jgi:hypothetical protein
LFVFRDRSKTIADYEGLAAYRFWSRIYSGTLPTGFSLTSAENGVMFDFWGNGHLIQIVWTSPASGYAFLALDRNHNGKIDSAKELFGNIT